MRVTIPVGMLFGLALCGTDRNDFRVSLTSQFDRPALLRGRHFPDEAIVLCVRCYLRYSTAIEI
jgi:hypothetical protein